MRKVYYIYNPKTRTYDRIYPTVRQRALSILRRLFVGMGLGAGSFIILLLIFGSPSEKELRIENTRLLAQYNVLSHRLDEAMGVMQDIQQRDDNLYRVVLQADPVSTLRASPPTQFNPPPLGRAVAFFGRAPCLCPTAFFSLSVPDSSPNLFLSNVFDGPVAPCS